MEINSRKCNPLDKPSQFQDKKLLDYPEVNIQLQIESRMKSNVLRKICGIRDCLP
jgi:hypothetical protein